MEPIELVNTGLDSINLETSLYQLSDMIIKVVNEIQSRIRNIFGNVYYEMAVVMNTSLVTADPVVYTCAPLNVPFVYDNSIPDGVVFIVCKSIQSHSLIKPRGDISWYEFYAKVVNGDQPGLSIDAPYLQAKIMVTSND